MIRADRLGSQPYKCIPDLLNKYKNCIWHVSSNDNL